MPTTRIQVAWAVPVKIEQLGAHLEAYSSLQPVFNEVRLCNRFGSGPKAAITKLPFELVKQVERYLIQDKQEELVPAWTRDLRCWENVCIPGDHLEDSDVLELYNGLQDAQPDMSDCGWCYSVKMAMRVTKHVREYVEEELEELTSEGEDGIWRLKHDDHVWAWHGRVGSPTSQGRGLFDEISSVLLKHFGLQAWISHVQESRELHLIDENTAYTTKAYIYLPQSELVQHNFKQFWVDCDFKPRRRPTEDGFSSELSIPQSLSSKESGRFIRAFKALDIEALSAQKVLHPTQSSESESSDAELIDNDNAPVDVEVKPKLTLLVRNDDDELW
ncbi:hypothetical protein BST61_g8043 [Cercospora zeina]